MFSKIKTAKEFRASMALQAQNLAPTLPGDDVCWHFSILVSPPVVSPFTRNFFSLSFTVLNLKQPLEASNENDDYGGTVPSRPYNIGLQVANEVPAPSSLTKQHILGGTEQDGEGMHALHFMSLSTF